MNRKDALNIVQKVIQELFNNSEIIITDSTVSSDVDGWDSFETINVFVTLEDEFGIHFDLKEISCIKNVGELVDCILFHLNEG